MPKKRLTLSIGLQQEELPFLYRNGKIVQHDKDFVYRIAVTIAGPSNTRWNMTQSRSQTDSSPTPLTKASRILIVGAGAFGLSTAFHLLGRGYTNVTVLDRAKELPAVDAASTDINKGVSK